MLKKQMDVHYYFYKEEHDSPETVWEGKIDLSEGVGTIVIKERSGDNCWN